MQQYNSPFRPETDRRSPPRMSIDTALRGYEKSFGQDLDSMNFDSYDTVSNETLSANRLSPNHEQSHYVDNSALEPNFYVPQLNPSVCSNGSFQFDEKPAGFPIHSSCIDTFDTQPHNMQSPITPVQYGSDRWSTPSFFSSPSFSGSSLSGSSFSNSSFMSDEASSFRFVDGSNYWVENGSFMDLLPQHRKISGHSIPTLDLQDGILTAGTCNPALARNIFGDDALPSLDKVEYGSTDWQPAVEWSISQTIAPKATFEPVLPSSPLPHTEVLTPVKTPSRSNTYLSSSPSTSISAKSEFGSLDANLMLDFDPGSTMPSQLVRISRKYERGDQRSQRYSCSRKVLSSSGQKLKGAVTKSGINCEPCIPPNSLPCMFGCKDKEGKLRRFKRQEHRKRHEKTVHRTDDSPIFYCWVKGCPQSDLPLELRDPRKAAGFSRTDNLNTHYRTHGKNTNGQRNRYVASLDENSPFFDENWKGELTADGYPVTPGVATMECSNNGCKELLYTEKGMKEHLLKAHGQATGKVTSATASNCRGLRKREI